MRRGRARILGVAFGVAAALIAQFPAAAGAAQLPADAGVVTIQGGRYGAVEVTEPGGAMRGIVVLFSSLAGWRDADRQAARLLAQHDILVVGVDTARYLATLAATQEACHRVVSDAEGISHQLQRALKSSAYFSPIVAGTGQGGALARQVLAAAASNTIAGAVAIDPDPTSDARFNPCPPDPTILHDPGLPGFFTIAATAAPTSPTAGTGATAGTAGAGEPMAAPPEQAPPEYARLDQESSAPERRDFPPGTPRAEVLLATIEPHLGPRTPDQDDVSDLPLVELPAEHPGNMLAIVVSGDGGWRDLDKTIARNLRDAGVSVIGIDSLRYFWRAKTPAQTAHDLGRAIQTYMTRWHAKSVALIGYSFGADILPFVYNRLPPRARASITLISLLGFAEAADFEIRVTGWLGLPPGATARSVRPEIARVPAELVQCFYGEDEVDTICPELAKTGVVAIRTPGSHHFGHDYEHLSQAILKGWRRRMTRG